MQSSGNSVMPEDKEGKLAAARLEEDAAARALAGAKEAHDAARAEYVEQFSLARRAFKDFGSRTKAYRAEHIAPLEEQLREAEARWDLAEWSLRQQECEAKRDQMPESLPDHSEHESSIGPMAVHVNPMY
mmetsp:Transcript_3232/g.5228  ORF Transcript_3232/g.5228 Transcript_3232/m.5228 type:complete len:130 (+) Transcript_3232:67-456(+)